MIRAARPLTGLLAGGLLLLAAIAGPARSFAIAPQALSNLASGEILILAEGRVYRYKSGSRNVVPVVKGFGLFEGVDLEVAVIGGVESILVTKISRSETGSRVTMYDLAGKPKGEWAFPPWKGECSGVAVDPQASVAFVASPESSEIFRLDLKKPGRSPVPITKISEAAVLGPMVFDESRKRLLVADSVKGTLHSVAVESGRSEILATRLGEPSALAFDAKTRQLFIADASGRRIWLLDLDRQEAQPRVFIKPKEFRDPMGLALAPDGSLWVGDLTAKALFQVSREGKIIFTFKL